MLQPHFTSGTLHEQVFTSNTSAKVTSRGQSQSGSVIVVPATVAETDSGSEPMIRTEVGTLKPKNEIMQNVAE